MPNVSFSLECLKLLTNLSPEELKELSFGYGLEAEIRDDWLEVEVTAERPDLLSVEGFARVIKSFKTGEIRIVPDQLEDSGLVITVDKAVEKLRPYIAALVAEGVKLNSVTLDALIKFQEKICETFGRRRKKIAIGIYDLSEIKGDVKYSVEDKNLVSFIPLKGKKKLTGQQILTHHPTGIKFANILLSFEKYVPVLSDSSGQILSMPPIINAHNVGNVTTRTSSIFIDVTGTSERAVKEVLNIVAHNFLDIDAQVKKVTIQYPENSVITPCLKPKKMAYSLNVLNRTIGVDLSKYEFGKYIRKMDLCLESEESDNNVVIIPSYRTDIIGEADIAGDLLVAMSLDDLEPEVDTAPKQRGKSNTIKDFACRVSDLSERIGLREVKSLVLMDPEQLSLFSSNYVQTANAKSRRFSCARTSLQPGIIEILSKNIMAPKPINVYEIGEILCMEEDGNVNENVAWSFASLSSQSSFTIAKSYVQTILKGLKMDFEFSECDEKRYIPGRAAYVIVNGIEVGHFGEIHPEILSYFSFPEPICTGELNCQLLLL